MGVTKEEAQEIYEKVMEEFPMLKEYMLKCEEFAYNHGYTETLFGRRRALEFIGRHKYTFKMDNEHTGLKSGLLDFNTHETNAVPKGIQWQIINELDSCKYYKQKREVIENARRKYGVIVYSNEREYGDDTRKCVNTPIQGSASDQVKLAMIAIDNDKELNDLGVKILIQIHDEVLCECPKENIVKGTERLRYIMEHVLDGIISVPIKCDVSVSEYWEGPSLNEELGIGA